MKNPAHPVSLRLDEGLLRRAAAVARRRKVGLTTGLRMIVSEHLDEEEASADLDAALRWQRQQAWASFESWQRGEAGELSIDDLRRAHAAVLSRTRAGRR